MEWAKLKPSMFPLGGGLYPFPPVPGWWRGRIPSTVPGMIYIVLLLMDDIEERMADEIEGLAPEEQDCDNAL